MTAGPTDVRIFHWINGVWPDWLEPFFIFWSEGNKWWPVRIGLLLLLAYLAWKPKLRLGSIGALLAVPLANEACDILKAGFRMLRPTVQIGPDEMELRVNMLTSFGTSSAHSANMAATAVVFWSVSRPLGIVWTFVAFFTGLSRIYVGAHFPSQVLLGWAVGAVVGLIVVTCLRLVSDRISGRSKQTEDPSAPHSPESRSTPLPPSS